MKNFITLLMVPFFFFIACGDDGSNENPLNPPEPIYSSTNIEESSSSQKSRESFSEKVGESSSSQKSPRSSSKKAEKSSSSQGLSGSSSQKVKESSSSQEPSSSSSEKTEESSSSQEPSSSSSEKTEESSSSQEPSSSSSEKTEESSSSLSSSVAESSSSSLITTGICKTATEDNCVYGTLHDDRDGKNYKTIKIGTQEWMAENLNYEISRISKTSIWSTCYENSGDSCAKYGRYYTWTAAIDSIALYDSLSLQCGSGKTCSTIENYKIKGICPDNSHLPSLKEWQTLLSFVGASKAGKMLKSTDKFWGGEDSFGFSVLPSGRVTNSSPDGGGVGEVAYFWTTKDSDNYGAKSLVFYSDRENVQTITSTKGAMAALTVRCIKD